MKRLAIAVFLMATFIASPVWAISDENDFTNDFGMVGITGGQTARLNVVNTITDPGMRPCTVELRFFDSHGGLLGGPDTKVLGAREAAFSDFAVIDSGIRPGRLQIRAQVSVKFNNSRERKACSNNLKFPRWRCSTRKPAKPYSSTLWSSEASIRSQTRRA